MGGAAPAAAQGGGEDAEPPGRVLVVSMPRLVWQDVADLAPPNLVSLLEQSAVASLSVRAIGPRTDLGEGYVTLGAGNRARVQRDRAGDAVDADEALGPNTGAELYRAVTGEDPGDAAVLSLAIGDAVADADRLLYGSAPGAMGQAIADAGLSAAVIANADGGPPLGADERHREAALAMMDEAGRVAGGTVGSQLGVVDLAAPGGRRMDPEAVLAAFDEAWEGGSSAVLVEMSDLERADRNGLPPTGPERAAGLATPLAEADELLGELLERVDLSRDRVLVVSPAAPGNFGRLTTFAMAGRGIEPGRARSATTRRDGFVTLPDVGATVLDSLDLDLPGSMNSTAITSSGGSPFVIEDAGRLADVDEIARFRDRTVGPVSVVYIVLQVLTYGLAALALSRRSRRLRPVVGWRGARHPRHPAGGLPLGAVAVRPPRAGPVRRRRLRRRRRGRRAGPADPAVPRLPPRSHAGGGELVAAARRRRARERAATQHPVRVLTDRRRPVPGVRQPGLRHPRRQRHRGGDRGVEPAPAGVAARRRRGLRDAAVEPLVGRRRADRSPSWSTVCPRWAPTSAVCWPRCRPSRWSSSCSRGGGSASCKAVVVGAVTLGALAALAALDLSRPESSRTHLGRFAQRIADGDAGIVVERKLQSNLSILTSSVWTWLVPVCLAFVAFLALRRTGYLHRLQRRVPGVRACLLGALVVGTLGFALNDSGVAVPAMMFGIVLPWVIWLLLETERAP